jgi:hypothetical protein
VTYSGSVTRHLEVVQNINVVPDEARFLDRHPENRNPQNPASPLPSEFLRPYRGYQDINIRSHFGTSDYNGLQIQLNRRYIRGLQFSAAYTFGKTRGIADEDEAAISAVRPVHDWHYAPYASNQTQRLVVTYTWDIPGGSRLWDNAAMRLAFDNWQLSGENAFVTGDWMPVILTTADNFDFTGGDGGTRPRITGDPLCSSGNCDVTPGAGGSYFNIDAFSRLTGRGDIGNAPVTFYRLPKIVLSNMSIFKNFQLGGGRRIQIRWEAYNVFNQVNWSSLNTTAQFNPAGQQVNASFGQATGARDARVMQGAIRFSF